MAQILADLSDDLATTVAKASTSVVRVEGRDRYYTSGVAWANDVIVTADHVIERDGPVTVGVAGSRSVPVTLAGPEPVGMPWRSRSREAQHAGITLKARLIARDVKRDLVALSVDALDLPVMSLADSGLFQPDEIVQFCGILGGFSTLPRPASWSAWALVLWSCRAVAATG